MKAPRGALYDLLTPPISPSSRHDALVTQGSASRFLPPFRPTVVLGKHPEPTIFKMQTTQPPCPGPFWPSALPLFCLPPLCPERCSNSTQSLLFGTPPPPSVQCPEINPAPSLAEHSQSLSAPSPVTLHSRHLGYFPPVLPPQLLVVLSRWLSRHSKSRDFILFSFIFLRSRHFVDGCSDVNEHLAPSPPPPHWEVVRSSG